MKIPKMPYLSSYSRQFLLMLVWLLFTNATFGQNIETLDADNKPVLTQDEADYLNTYLKKERNKFDFTQAKVIFITGSSGSKISSKSAYFDDIRKWSKASDSVVSHVYVLTESQKMQSGGYDVIIAFWAKVLTKRRINKILSEINGL